MATVAELLTKIGFSADTKPLEKIEQRLESLNHKLRLIVGVEVLKKLTEMTSELGHGALELMNTASAAGLTTEAMQGLQYAVTQAGGNAGELGMTMTHIAREMHGARMGAEDALQTFYQLGISQQQVASFRTTEDALYGIMGALQKIQDPIRRQALMDRALGQGSRALGRFALNGEAAARASEALAKRLGVNIPNSTLTRLAEARNQTMSLGLIFKSLTAQVAGGFAPALVQAIHGLQDFYVANRRIIDVGIGKFIESTTYGFGELYAVVYIVARAFTDFVHRHQKLTHMVASLAPALAASAAVIPLLNTALRLFNVVGGVALAIFTGFSAEAVGFGLAIGTAVAAVVLLMATLVSYGQVIRKHGLKGLFDADNWKDTALFKGLDMLKSGVDHARAFGGALRDAWGEFGDQPFTPSAGLVNQDPASRYGAPDSLLAPKGSSLLERLNAVAMAQSTLPPAYASQSNSAIYSPQVTNNFAVNVPSGMTFDQAKTLVTQSVRDANQLSLEQAMRQTSSPFQY